VLVTDQLNVNLRAQPAHDHAATLEAEDEARREAVADRRRENPDRIRRRVTTEWGRLVDVEIRVPLLVEAHAEVESSNLFDVEGEVARRFHRDSP
jgi:hypothetical protein